jgi:hypothetical protein
MEPTKTGIWYVSGVERDLVNFLDHEREIELAKVNTLEGDEEVVVMKNQELRSQCVGPDIIVTERTPMGTVLETEP